VVVPGSIHHSGGPGLLTVTHKIRDVPGGRVDIRKDLVPGVRAGTYELLEAGVFERLNRSIEIVAGAVLPVSHNHVFGNIADPIRLIERNCSTKNQPPIVSFDQITHPIQMLEVNRTNSFGLGYLPALPFAEFEGFIFTDVKKLARK